MGLFSTVKAPALPNPTSEKVDHQYVINLLGILRLYFTKLDAIQPVNIAKLNFDINTLPTQADLANLRSGDVYRDTTAAHVLKVKP